MQPASIVRGHVEGTLRREYLDSLRHLAEAGQKVVLLSA